MTLKQEGGNLPLLALHTLAFKDPLQALKALETKGQQKGVGIPLDSTPSSNLSSGGRDQKARKKPTLCLGPALEEAGGSIAASLVPLANPSPSAQVPTRQITPICPLPTRTLLLLELR